MFLEAQNKIILEDREKTLIELGLTEKEYSPDGKESYLYSKYDYVSGEKKYYRDIAISVTDDEYELILSKVKQVEDIRAKEEKIKLREISRKSNNATKKWIPIFEKPKDESSYIEEKKPIDNGKSKMASVIRGSSWTISIIALLFCIFLSINSKNIFPIVIVLCADAIYEIVAYTGAAILDYLAELTSIARNGFKYKETYK